MVPGAEPDENALTSTDFHTLGCITARMHDHARGWQRPAGFSRFAWDWEHAWAARPRWGRWQDGIGVGAQETEVLGRAEQLLGRRLAEYGIRRRHGSAWSTPTCGWPTCWSTVTRSP